MISSIEAHEERFDKIEGSLGDVNDTLGGVKEAMIAMAKSNQKITNEVASLKRAANVGSVEAGTPGKKKKVTIATSALKSNEPVADVNDLDGAEDIVSLITNKLNS